MKSYTRAILLATTTLLAARATAACSSDETSPSTPSDVEAGVDASSETGIPQPTDAGADAADATGASDAADVDAGDVPACSNDGWCATTLPTRAEIDAGPPPSWGPQTLFTMNSVWVAPDHRAWAVTAGGHLLSWNGTAWSLATLLDGSYNSIWGSSATDLWIGGNGAKILHVVVSGTNVTVTPVSMGDSWEDVKSVTGTSNTDVWAVGGSGGVYHLESTPDDSGGTTTAFALQNMPSAFPGDYNPFQAKTLWTTGSDVWIAGTDCDPQNWCETSEITVRKWKGGNDGDASWDNLRFPMGDDESAIFPRFSRLSTATGTKDGVTFVVIENDGSWDSWCLRIAASDDKLTGTPIEHSNGYSWVFDTVVNFEFGQGAWGSDSKNVWIAGSMGMRSFDGSWHVGQVAIDPKVPLTRALHGVHGIVDDTSGNLDMWTVGDDVALHRVVKP